MVMQPRHFDSGNSTGSARFPTARERHEQRNDRITRNFRLFETAAVIGIIGTVGAVLLFSHKAPMVEQPTKAPASITEQQTDKQPSLEDEINKTLKQNSQAPIKLQEAPKQKTYFIDVPLGQFAADRKFMTSTISDIANGEWAKAERSGSYAFVTIKPSEVEQRIEEAYRFGVLGKNTYDEEFMLIFRNYIAKASNDPDKPMAFQVLDSLNNAINGMGAHWGFWDLCGDMPSAFQGNEVFRWQPEIFLEKTGEKTINGVKMETRMGNVRFQNMTSGPLTLKNITVKGADGKSYSTNVNAALGEGQANDIRFSMPPVEEFNPDKASKAAPEEIGEKLVLEVTYAQGGKVRTTTIDLDIRPGNVAQDSNGRTLNMIPKGYSW